VRVREREREREGERERERERNLVGLVEKEASEVAASRAQFAKVKKSAESIPTFLSDPIFMRGF
jgi:hypothetical protein